MPVGTWEKALALLQDGDILLYQPVNGISALISGAEWINGNEADRYCHAGLVVDLANKQGCEQNPPAVHYTALDQEDWSRIDIWRVKPQIKLDIVKLRAFCSANIGVSYPYAKYFRFIDAAILARVGLTGAALAEDNGGSKAADVHWEVCSAFAADGIDHAKVDSAQVVWTKPNDENERPADLPLGQIFQVNV